MAAAIKLKQVALSQLKLNDCFFISKKKSCQIETTKMVVLNSMYEAENPYVNAGFYNNLSAGEFMYPEDLTVQKIIL